MGHDESNPTLITGGSDGRLVEWSVADGSTKLIQGELLEHAVEKQEENFSHRKICREINSLVNS